MSIFENDLLAKWGIVDYGYTEEEIPFSLDHYNHWVENEKHLPLTYLEGTRKTQRENIKNVWPDFQSAIVFLFSYHETHQKLQNLYKNDSEWNGLKIASYTLGFEGEDYHNNIKLKLQKIGDQLSLNHENLQFKISLDIHPILERDLAFRTGLGWFGKNSMLINKSHGSFFIIGSLLLNTKIPELNTNKTDSDHCGQCTRCIDACPTSAIDPESRTIIAKDCISTFTIEQFKLDSIPSEKMNLADGEIFGCDICQDVCPWNIRLDKKTCSVDSVFTTDKQNELVDFFLKTNSLNLKSELEKMSQGSFRKKFTNTSFERSGKRGIYKNILLYLKNRGII